MTRRFPAARPAIRRRILAKLAGLLRPAMPFRPLAALLALWLAVLAPAAHAEGYSPDAQRVLARAFAATGGKAWWRLRGWHETGRRGGVAYESWIDPVRYGLRVEIREPQGLRIEGFNGQAEWQVAPDGAITAVNDHATLARARTEAFFAASCYFFPGRFDARGDYLGVRSLRGRSYEVVRVAPWNGEPRELWFDARTHLLARIVDRTGRRPSALQVSDYRRMGPVLAAFRFTPEPGAPADLLARQVESLAFAPADRASFSLNRPEELAKVQRYAVSAPMARSLPSEPRP
jgi:hypothetical protein